MVLPGPEKRVSVVDAKPEHVEAILADVRSKDRAEWVCGTGLPLGLLLRYAVEEAEGVRTALDPDGVPLAIWGLDSVERTEGTRGVWLIATNRAEKHVLSFHRFLHGELTRLHKAAGDAPLAAWADQRNSVHLKWLRRIGFNGGPSLPTGPLGLPYKFFWRNKCAVP